MTAVHHTTIFCDGRRDESQACSNWVIGDDAKDARKDARRSGWRTGLPGGKDFCRTHRGQVAAPIGPSGHELAILGTDQRHSAQPGTDTAANGPGTVTG